MPHDGDIRSQTIEARSALDGLVPYEPGRPIEDVQRDLGLERVVKLASNEGPYGPFPRALDALAAGIGELNRYPDGGMVRLREALAARHGVAPEHVVAGAGADGLIACLSLAYLDPGDEVVCGWPSFPSYVIDATRMGAHAVRVQLDGERYDLGGLLAAIGPRTRIVYVCNPNNPTGTMVGREQLAGYFERVPEHVLTVLDEAYFEYVDDADYPDGIEEAVKQGRRALVLRTFSKIYGLAGLRVGYAVAPADVIAAIRKVQDAFDVSQPAQDAALASLDDEAELGRRRRENAQGRRALAATLAEHGFEVTESVTNFVFARGGGDAGALYERLLREGVIVRPMHAFGAADAIRVSVGTPEELEIFRAALGRALAAR